MIKRLIPKKLVPVEKLTEDFNVGAGGIDVSSPPTKPNTVYDMENLNIDLDGGVSLRKPLLYNNSSKGATDTVYVNYIFDDSKIELTTETSAPVFVNLENSLDTKYVSQYVNIDDPTDIIPASKVIYTEFYPIYINGVGLSIKTDKGETVPLISIKNTTFNIINTNTSTIILGFQFDLSIDELVHYSKHYDIDKNNFKNRPVRITKDNSGNYSAEVMQIETATLYTGDNNVTRASFNLMDDYIYSFKDNYDAGYAYTQGILKYTPNKLDKDINAYTIEELTESDKFRLVDSITKNDFDKTYILKAFVTNTAVDNPTYKLYCTWEKTYDNVTWTNVPEFLDKFENNTISLKIEDSSKSYENSEDSYHYTRTVQYTPFININSSNTDAIALRPDVLVLDNVDSATYRFSIRSVATTPNELATKVRADYCFYNVISGTSEQGGRSFISVNSEKQASVTFKFHFEVEGNDPQTVQNVRLTARTIFDGTGTDWYDKENTFGDDPNSSSLTNAVLDTIFTSYSITWTVKNNILIGETAVPINMQLFSNWITQLLCIAFYLYEGSNPETSLPILWKGTFSCPIGINMSTVSPERNPIFKYYTENMKIDTGTSLKIISGDSDHPDCYSMNLASGPLANYIDNSCWLINGEKPGELLPITATHVAVYPTFANVSWRETSGKPNDLNVELYASIDDISGVNDNDVNGRKIPLELLNNLSHSADVDDAYKLYLFNNFEYYLKNITVNVTLNIKTTVWVKYNQNNIFNPKSAFSDITVSIKNIKLNLQEYLNLNNNITPLKNQIEYLYANAEVTNSNHGNFSYTMDYSRGNSSMSDSDYNKIKNIWEFGPGYASCEVGYAEYGFNHDGHGNRMAMVYTKSLIIPAFVERIVVDVINRISPTHVKKSTLSLNYSYSYSYTLDMLNANTSALLDTEHVFKYDQQDAWKYEYLEDIIRIQSPVISENVPNHTPESAQTKDVDYGSTPFKYLFRHNSLTHDNTLIRLIGDGANLNVLGVYDTMKLSSSSNVYVFNKSDEVLPEEKFANLDDVASYLTTRYSLLLAETPDTILVTKDKQINDYPTINLYGNNTLYYDYKIWYYGKNLKNNIYFSNSDSIVSPIDNCITLSTDTDDYVTSLVPWRDYLVATTFKNIYLISKYNDSYVFKQINTFIGVPEADADTCKAILNGIIFKSGNAIYALHPNTYSSDDTILNITDISKPISHHLIKGTDNFAISTEYEYYVFIPRDTDTLVFKYEYSRKVWNKFTYPVKLCKAKLFNVGDIVVLDNLNNVYDFDKTLDWYKDKLSNPNLQYGDYLNEYTDAVKPISFYLDTGQKSSDMQVTKQFTESKLLISTKDNLEVLASNTKIYVDGFDLKVSHTTDIGNLTETSVTYDNPSFSKTHPSSLPLITNTNFDNEFNVMRQIIFRYMGKGKTIRHVFEGKSAFNFKIYVLYYRYRIPHNKQ